MDDNHAENDNKKPVTLDDLAEMVASGFAETDKKFEELEVNISQLPTKSYIDEKFANLEGDLIKTIQN